MSDIKIDEEGKEMLERMLEIAKQLNVSDDTVKEAIDFLDNILKKERGKQATLNTRIAETTNNLLRSYVESSHKSIAFTVNEALKEYLERMIANDNIERSKTFREPSEEN